MKVYIDQAYFMDYSNSIEVVMCEYGTQNNIGRLKPFYTHSLPK